MSIKFNKSSFDLTLKNNCVLKNFDPQKSSGDNKNKLIFNFNAGTNANCNIGNVQQKLIEALAGGHICEGCEDPDNIVTLTEADLEEAHKRFLEKDYYLFGDIKVKEFKYNAYYGTANITTEKGDVLNIDLLTKAEKRDGADSSKGLFPSSKKIPASIKKQKPEKLKTVNWNENSQQSYIEWKQVKSYEEYLHILGKRESCNNYGIKNTIGYLGRFQMGELALIDAGFYEKDDTNINDWKGNWTVKAKKHNVTSPSSFLKNPKAQDIAYEIYLKKQWQYIKNFKFDKSVYSEINGITITASGLLAAAHLVGIGNLKIYLESNGNNIPCDQYGTSIEEYLRKFSGIDISRITN